MQEPADTFLCCFGLLASNRSTWSSEERSIRVHVFSPSPMRREGSCQIEVAYAWGPIQDTSRCVGGQIHLVVPRRHGKCWDGYLSRMDRLDTDHSQHGRQSHAHPLTHTHRFSLSRIHSSCCTSFQSKTLPQLSQSCQQKYLSTMRTLFAILHLLLVLFISHTCNGKTLTDKNLCYAETCKAGHQHPPTVSSNLKSESIPSRDFRALRGALWKDVQEP